MEPLREEVGKEVSSEVERFISNTVTSRGAATRLQDMPQHRSSGGRADGGE
jgi:hypothetical protein